MNLILCTTQGNIKITLKNDSKLIDLKNKINDEIRLKVEEQKLKFNDQLLENDQKCLFEYDIIDGSEIKLIKDVIKEHFKLSILRQNEEPLVIKVCSSNALEEVKKEIQSHIQMSPEEQILIYAAKELCGNEIISSYGVRNDSEIQLIPRITSKSQSFYDKSMPNSHTSQSPMQLQLNSNLTRPGMQVFGKTLDGKTITLEVIKTDRIIDVKKKIQEKIGLSPDEQVLIYQGGILADDKTIDEYLITEKSVINIVSRLRKRMHILGKTTDGKIIAFEVFQSDKIIDVKNKIQEKIGLSQAIQQLLYEDVIMEDDKTIFEYQIVDNGVINIVVELSATIIPMARQNSTSTSIISRESIPSDEKIKIFVRTPQVISLDVLKSDRIIEVKGKINEIIGVNPEKQILRFNRKLLADTATVEDCQLVERSFVNLETK